MPQQVFPCLHIPSKSSEILLFAEGLVFVLIVKGPIILPLPKVYYNFSNKSPFKVLFTNWFPKGLSKEAFNAVQNVESEYQ